MTASKEWENMSKLIFSASVFKAEKWGLQLPAMAFFIPVTHSALGDSSVL